MPLIDCTLRPSAQSGRCSGARWRRVCVNWWAKSVASATCWK